MDIDVHSTVSGKSGFTDGRQHHDSTSIQLHKAELIILY